MDEVNIFVNHNQETCGRQRTANNGNHDARLLYTVDLASWREARHDPVQEHNRASFFAVDVMRNATQLESKQP